jgi:hypothetical protein
MKGIENIGVVPCFLMQHKQSSSTLKKGAVCSSETLVPTYISSLRYYPEYKQRTINDDVFIFALFIYLLIYFKTVVSCSLPSPNIHKFALSKLQSQQPAFLYQH